jgi:hypothetical protein
MKPICVKCQMFYHPKENSVDFIEQMPTKGDTPAKPGTVEPERWTPSKIWMGDLWECRGCGATIIVGTAQSPISDQFNPDFDHYLKTINPTVQVNDLE